jgi:hypothetical protein
MPRNLGTVAHPTLVVNLLNEPNESHRNEPERAHASLKIRLLHLEILTVRSLGALLYQD